MNTRMILASAFLLPALTLHAAAPANLGLTTQTVSPVITGAQVPLNAFVYNLAAPGANNLNYTILYTLPDNSQFQDTGSRAADNGNTPDFWQVFLNTTGQLGVLNTTVNVDDPNAQNSPQIQQLSVTVLKHATPGAWINGTLVTPGVKEPSVDPLAFGATGGGESFAGNAPGIVADPPPAVPTAKLNLDSIIPHGDPQITITLQPFTNLVPDDSPSAGVPWQVIVDATHAGSFTTFFDLNFSDEQDLLGHNSPNSIHWEFQINATVSPDLSTVTGELIILPEPTTLTLLALPLLLTLTRKRPVTT